MNEEPYNLRYIMKTIKTLIVSFNNHISPKDVPLFRGAVIQSLEDKNVLYHNHTEDGFRYSYPLIQYKSIEGKATMVCVESGTDTIGEMFKNLQFTFSIKGKCHQAEVTNICAYQTTVTCEDTLFHYQLQRWLPLNSTNYAVYNSTESLAIRVELLEKILIGNIMSFLKGTGIHMDDEIKASITNIGKERIAHYKDVSLMCFDISFNSNIRLPHLIGLGKGASIGFGVLRIKNKTNH